MKSRGWALCLAGSSLLAPGFLLLTGCPQDEERRDAHHAVQDYRAGDYATAEDKLEKLATDQRRFRAQQLPTTPIWRITARHAEAAFPALYEASTASASTRADAGLPAVVDEKIKIWKGEPFDGDGELLSGFDLLSINKDYDTRGRRLRTRLKLHEYDDANDRKWSATESDFVVADLMLACWQRLGCDDMGDAQAFDRVVNAAIWQACWLMRSSLGEELNLLLVVDFGYGPEEAGRVDRRAFVGRPAPAAGRHDPAATGSRGWPANRRRAASFEPTIDLLQMLQ